MIEVVCNDRLGKKVRRSVPSTAPCCALSALSRPQHAHSPAFCHARASRRSGSSATRTTSLATSRSSSPRRLARAQRRSASKSGTRSSRTTFRWRTMRFTTRAPWKCTVRGAQGASARAPARRACSPVLAHLCCAAAYPAPSPPPHAHLSSLLSLSLSLFPNRQLAHPPRTALLAQLHRTQSSLLFYIRPQRVKNSSTPPCPLFCTVLTRSAPRGPAPAAPQWAARPPTRPT